MHDRSEGGQRRVAATGVAAVLPYGRFREVGEEGAEVLGVSDLLHKVTEQLEDERGLKKVMVRGLRLYGGGAPGGDRYSLGATAFGDPSPRFGSGASDVVAEGSRLASGLTVDRFKMTTLAARAAYAMAPVFQDDPMSSRRRRPPGEEHDPYDRRRRPTRREDMLEFYRDRPFDFPDDGVLEVGGEFRIEASRFVDNDPKNENGVKIVTIDPADPPLVRSSDFAALSAFQHAHGLFERMRDYGIDPANYFRHVRLPLSVHYRSGVAPGPGKDGQTVNARVNRQLDKEAAADQLPSVEIHLALANASHRHRKPWNGEEPSQAEPLGIATAERWMQHEFGHVLLLAALGELEFRFAHSPGDALAAINADPHSRLADHERLRGVTFPWTHPKRRHDRSVLTGWAWGGAMNPSLSVKSGDVIKGYRAEQILSTTLFRLYRCLGGDSDALATREAAAHYVIYLTMKALQLAALPPVRVEDFVDLLIQADVATATPFSAKLRSGGRTPQRLGGAARKLIRFAFEAQGLYQATDDPKKLVNGPGEPPAVDVYIADRRDLWERTTAGRVRYGPGGYAPVPLDESDGAAWLGAGPALVFDGANALGVKIGNRGREDAEKVSVSLWWRPGPLNWATAGWPGHDANWTACQPPANPERTVPAGGEIDFNGFSAGPPAKDGHVFLAAVACAADRANTDAAANLPCRQPGTRLIDLVAGDNNLALWVFP
jgi:hypothetical protein